jgi:hypothetical protein
MKVKHMSAYGDSQLVVQQVLGEIQCLDAMLTGAWKGVRS